MRPALAVFHTGVKLTDGGLAVRSTGTSVRKAEEAPPDDGAPRKVPDSNVILTQGSRQKLPKSLPAPHVTGRT